ncbi:MAG: transcriptional regulator [Erysipelotrichia bacterium]|nr:transcriptional regulator [Erysipelotrichia bacterium]NCC55762.1 transcriptional regulator [Erysipelotrichia bacterium]
MNCERKQAIRYLKTVRGQIDGILKMIEDERYCIDISNQISASTALLKKANVEILQGHLNSCLITAIENHENLDEKMNEIHDVLYKISK